MARGKHTGPRTGTLLREPDEEKIVSARAELAEYWKTRLFLELLLAKKLLLPCPTVLADFGGL